MRQDAPFLGTTTTETTGSFRVESHSLRNTLRLDADYDHARVCGTAESLREPGGARLSDLVLGHRVGS